MVAANHPSDGSTRASKWPGWLTPRVRTAAITAASILLLVSIVVLGILALVKASGAAAVVETNAFRSKASIFYALLACACAVAGLRCRRERMDYFLAAEHYEDIAIRADAERLQAVRQASWSNRAGRASTYSSISLGLIIVIALLFVANRDAVERQQVEALFIWVILIASVSVVFYGVSLQLWDEALGDGYEIDAVVELRRGALVLSSLGWITLVSALGLAVISVHTPLGALVGAVGVVAGLYVFEHKWRLAHAGRHAHLEGGILAYCRRVLTGRPVIGRP